MIKDICRCIEIIIVLYLKIFASFEKIELMHLAKQIKLRIHIPIIQ
jgi:hypothetical protein